MVRVTKNPEERKKEIMDVAEELFLTKGYKATLVSEIVKNVGVAQGTFYYHFESKDAILFAILKEKLSYFTSGLERIVQNQEMDAIQKLKLVFKGFLSTNEDTKQGTDDLSAHLTSQYHQMLDESRLKMFQPIIQSIVEQGIEEKTFIVNYPEEITEILFIGINGFMHNHYMHFKDETYLAKKTKALEELLEKALGIQMGGLNFSD